MIAFVLWTFVLGIAFANRGFYEKSKNVLELNHRTFDDYVFESNHTTVIEFYAPWCGYCKQFKPEFKKTAHLASDYAQFGAINCDVDENKHICSKYYVKGYPTVMVFRPPKNFDEEVERIFQYAQDTYQGERSALKLVDFVKGKVKNFTKKITPSKLPNFLGEGKKGRVLLITDSASAPAMFKGLAIDFKDSFDFAYVSAKTKKVRDDIKDMLQIPNKLKSTMVLYIDEDGTIVVHEGVLEKEEISEFLSRYATPTDGPLSERSNIIMGIKSGKFRSFQHYEKLKFKKQRKESKKKKKQEESASAEESTVKKDEL